MGSPAAVPDLQTSAGQPEPAARLGLDRHRGASGPVRVMHVIFALQPGGMEFGVLKVVNGLDPSEIRSSICSTTPAVAEMVPLLSADVPLFELHRRPGNDPRVVRELYALFRRERPDIVHTHAWGTLLEGLLAARAARVPRVIHGEHGTLQLSTAQRWAQRLGWGRADRVLSVSSRLAERMSRATGFPAGRIHTIRNGVDLSRFSRADRTDARDALGLTAHALVIGTVGRLVQVKDQARLIDAAATLRDQGIDCVALIAGEGPLRPDLDAQIARRGLAGRVRLLGHRGDVERVLAALDVFVLPSRSEGLSNTILEAMASGAAVVATRVGGADELVDDGRTGILVPAEDTAALAAALADLLRDDGRRRAMAAAGRARAETAFGLPRMIADYRDLYLSMAGRTPSARRPDARETSLGH